MENTPNSHDNVPQVSNQQQPLGKTVTLILNHQRAQDLPGRISVAPDAVRMVAGMLAGMLTSEDDGPQLKGMVKPAD